MRATQRKVVSFDPKTWHATCPWSGQRTVTYYVSRGWSQVSEEVQGQLRHSGFRFPEIQEAHVIQNPGVWKQKFSSEQAKADEQAKRYLYLLHAATGHGSMRHLCQALKRRNAAPRVLELAKTFKCSICEERRKMWLPWNPYRPSGPRFQRTLDIGNTQGRENMWRSWSSLMKGPDTERLESCARAPNKLLLPLPVCIILWRVGPSILATQTA